jgi:hypothetical protein
MNKQFRTLIILGVALVALLAVWLGSTLIPGLKPEETTTAAETTAEQTLFAAEAASVARITVRNETGELVLTPKPSTDADGKATITWDVTAANGLPVSATLLKGIGDAALSVTYSEVITDSTTDLASFGLADSKVSLSITGQDGATHTITLGNELSSGVATYARLDQENRVVAVSPNYKQQASTTLLALIDTTKALGGLNFKTITGLTFDRLEGSLHLAGTSKVNNPEDATAGFAFTLSEPVSRPGNPTNLSPLVNGVLDLTGLQAVDLAPQDLSTYGLDQPRYQVKLDSSEVPAVTFSFGKSAGEGTYYMSSSALMTSNGQPVVMTVSSSQLKAVDLALEDYVDRYIALKEIWLVSSVDIDLGDRQFNIAIKMDKGQNSTDDGISFKLDGQDANIKDQKKNSLFSDFYQSLIGIQLAGFDFTATPANTTDSRIVYHLEADPETSQPAKILTIEFARRDAYTDYVFVDGQYTGYFANHQDTFTQDREGSEGLRTAYLKLKYAIDHAVNGVFNTEEGYQLN